MSGLIRISGGASTGKENKVPVVMNLLSSEQTANTISISYYANDYNGTIIRHYIYIDGVKTEITDNVVFDSEYSIFRYTITGLTKSTTYNIQIEVSDGLDVARSDILTVATKEYVIYGVRVNEENMNPKTRAEYIDDAKGMIPMSIYSNGSDWEKKFPFKEFKIVGLKNGQITKEINQKNKKQYLDGEAVPKDVDVMLKIPKIYWDFKSIKNGYELRISDIKFNETCDCYAHKVNGIEKDYIYVGIYSGYEENGKLRSISGVTPTLKANNEDCCTVFRTLAQANGKGYQAYNWFTHLLIQILYLIAYCNFDSQKVIGIGNNYFRQTGYSDGDSLFHRNNLILGIEDFYLYQTYQRIFIDGIFTKNTGMGVDINILLDNNNFDINEKYMKIENYKTYYSGIFVQKVIHSNECGFIVLYSSSSSFQDASNNVHYCDRQSFSYDGNVFASGNWEKENGVFSFSQETKSNSTKRIGTRLVYLGE